MRSSTLGGSGGGEWWQNRKKPIELPKQVCDLIDIIEHFTGTRVISIGNGPKGDEIVYIRRKQGDGNAKQKSQAKTKAKAKANSKAAPAEAPEKRIDPEDG